MPDSDKHLISNSSALSKLITPVSSPSQKPLLSQLVRTAADSAGCGWDARSKRRRGAEALVLYRDGEQLIQPFCHCGLLWVRAGRRMI